MTQKRDDKRREQEQVTALELIAPPASDMPEDITRVRSVDIADSRVEELGDTTSTNETSSVRADAQPVELRWVDKINPLRRSPPPIPQHRAVTAAHRAGWLSILLFQWVQPLIGTGYQRPLELNDIWTISPDQRATTLVTNFKGALRVRRVAYYSRTRRAWTPHYMVMAFYDSLKTDFLLTGACLFFGSCLQVLTPFALRYLILFIQELYEATPGNRPSTSHGVGLVIGIVLMQVVSSLCINHFYYRGMLTGGKLRASLIACISEKAMKLSGRARVRNEKDDGWTDGRINNLMSTDTSRLDSVALVIHRCYVTPLQIILALILLCINLGWPALVGFVLICSIIPLLGRTARKLIGFRQDINKITDQRIQLTQEAFSAIRVIKVFAWETKLEDRLAELRKVETTKMAILLMIRNAFLCAAMMTTVLASMLTFITYYLYNHVLDPAPIFSSLALFNALGTPLEMLPMALGRVFDAYASIKRIADFLDAEEQDDQTKWEPDSKHGIVVEHASFTWEEVISDEVAEKPSQIGIKEKEGIEVTEQPQHKAFQLMDVNAIVGRAELVAVIGAVGSGKSSLLSALAGDMRKIHGQVTLGGSRALCSQTAWIQNATIRQNIIFGKTFDQELYDKVIHACALQQDLDILPNGDMTEIGERGITLSGGQKQRVNIARAIYSNTDVMLLDDPLSAVDAHVGQHIMDKAICGLLRGKCRVLATHQLHFLRRVDRIVWLKDGAIYKTATFDELIANDAGFRALMSTTSKSKEKQDAIPAEAEARSEQVPAAPVKALSTALMQKESQATGSVKWEVYKSFAEASGTIWNIALVLLIMTVAQGAVVTTNLWLSWWTSDKFNLPISSYIGIYIGLTFAGVMLMFVYGTTVTTLCTIAGRNLLRRAIARTIRAPVSFFDTTPLGRITNRFSKDVDTVDNRLTENLCFLLFVISNILAVFGLVLAYYWFFVVALAPLLVLFLLAVSYYRQSAREIKRIEAVLRSVVYARFGETSTGAGSTTIRAYCVQNQFQESITTALDSMNGAYFLTFAGQRWLSIRVDAVAKLLLLAIGLLVVTAHFATDVDPSIGGLVLAYTLYIGQYLQESVHCFSDTQNDFNAVERLHQYAVELEQEAPARIGAKPSWPEQGAITFKDVEMRYRAKLPLVLKGLSFQVKSGERIGIVGRTGAGKSSIMTALFRLVELSKGSISIDDVDIAKTGLYELRSRLAMIPQDPTLFRGTVRSNLDPFNEHQDLTLWNALRSADLLNDNVTESTKANDRIGLDTVVEDEGHNFSLGQRQLLALARVLVRDSRIVICDEATSSVDFETDLRVQKTMLQAFKGKTLLCIAHRLKTIIGYDRILVMDGGLVAEYDTPLSLFDQGGIFKGMCDRSGITRNDIIASIQAQTA